MKRFLLFQLVMAMLMLSLFSCQKEDVEPEPEPEPVPEEIVFPCEHSELEYVAPVRRTSSTPGNIAHYHCTHCNRYFLDEGATREVNSPYLPALNLSLDTNVLNKIKDIFPFVPSSEQSKAGVADDVGKMFEKILGFNHNLTVRKELGDLIADLATIAECLENIGKQLSAIEAQNKAIITMLADEPYALDIQTLLNKEVFIYKESVKWFKWVKVEYDDYYAENTTKLRFLKNLHDIGSDWAKAKYNGSADIYPMTNQLIDDFDGCDIMEKTMTYPQVFHTFNNKFRIWDHEGYTDRKQLDLQAEASLSIGYFMACIYLYHTADYDYWRTRDEEAKTNANNFAKIDPLVDDDLNQMDLAYKYYRRFHDGNKEVYLCNSCTVVNPDKIDGEYKNYEFTFNYKNKNGWLAQGIDQVHKCWENKYNNSIGYNDGTALAAEDYATIRNAYVNGDIYKILSGTAKISGVPSSYKQSKSIDGRNRQMLVRYHSPNFTQSKEKTEKYSGSLNEGHGWYNEYYVDCYGCKSNIAGVVDLYCYGMNNSCCRDETLYNMLHYYYASDHTDWNSSFKLSGRSYSAKYQYYTDFAYGFVRFYKGTIYDKL